MSCPCLCLTFPRGRGNRLVVVVVVVLLLLLSLLPLLPLLLLVPRACHRLLSVVPSGQNCVCVCVCVCLCLGLCFDGCSGSVVCWRGWSSWIRFFCCFGRYGLAGGVGLLIDY